MMKTVSGKKLKLECWGKYSAIPDCPRRWMFYCPQHRVCEIGGGTETLQFMQEHLLKAHPGQDPVLG